MTYQHPHVGYWWDVIQHPFMGKAGRHFNDGHTIMNHHTEIYRKWRVCTALPNTQTSCDAVGNQSNSTPRHQQIQGALDSNTVDVQYLIDDGKVWAQNWM
jgi:hypothetical protein